VKARGGNISFRKVLVTLQFSISIILIIATAIVFNQMRFMQEKSLGFDKEHIITLPYVTELDNQFASFRTELLTNSSIKNAGRSSRIPTGRLLDAMGARMMSGDTLAPVNTTIANKYAGYTIESVNREFQKDRITYEIEMKKDNSRVKLLVDGDGNVIKEKMKS